MPTKRTASEVRGNKHQLRSEKTKKIILRAAAELFARQGYHKTTISDIARKIGMTHGAFFYHFSSKEKVLYGVIADAKQKVEGMKGSYVPSKLTSFERLETWLSIVCEFHRKHPELFLFLSTMAVEFAGSRRKAERQLKGMDDVAFETIVPLFKDHPKAKNRREVAMAIAGAIQGIAIQAHLRKNETSFDNLANALLSVIGKW